MVVTAPVKTEKNDARWAKTRRKLIDGGRSVFSAQGVEATTVLDIIRAAGVSQPSFYNHFESKDALAREIAAEFFRQDRERKLQVFEEVKDPAVAIAINVQQTLAIATDDPVIAWTFIKSDHLRALVISSEKDPLAAMIKAGVKQKRFDVRSARTVAITIRGAALAVVQDVLNGTADKNAVREFQCLVLRMLGISPQECTVVVKQAAALFRAASS